MAKADITIVLKDVDVSNPDILGALTALAALLNDTFDTERNAVAVKPEKDGSAKAKAKPAKKQKDAPAPAAKEEPAPEPTPEPIPEEDGKDEQEDVTEVTMDTAVEVATALIGDGRQKDVKDALKELGARRVSELKGDKIAAFVKALQDD